MYDVSLKRKWDAESIRKTAIIEQERARREGLEEGRQAGVQEGLEEGRQEERAKAEAEKLAEKKESALKMLQNGFEVKLISDILGLSVEEIDGLK